MTGVEMVLLALMISLMRGTPCVMFMLATPAKWNVLSVICVPGSPMLCAATPPTGEPAQFHFHERHGNGIWPLSGKELYPVGLAGYPWLASMSVCTPGSRACAICRAADLAICTLQAVCPGRLPAGKEQMRHTQKMTCMFMRETCKHAPGSVRLAS